MYQCGVNIVHGGWRILFVVCLNLWDGMLGKDLRKPSVKVRRGKPIVNGCVELGEGQQHTKTCSISCWGQGLVGICSAHRGFNDNKLQT